MSGLEAPEKAHITATCERFITDVLKPRFLPVVRPTEFNYPVDIEGKWHGTRYRFLQRYRSGFADNRGEEFDAPFVRLDWIAPDRFNIQWPRHTGAWRSEARRVGKEYVRTCRSGGQHYNKNKK